MTGAMTEPMTTKAQPALTPASSETFAPELSYRAVSKMAVVAALFGLLSFLALLFPTLLLLPTLAIVFGLIGWTSIRRYPEELSGKPFALGGMFLGGGLLLAATALHVTVYLTEVPEGYERISFRELQPGESAEDFPVPRTAKALDGQPVFVKGYVHPDAGMGPVRRFVLVPDMGTCCFGGQPKLTDMIEVTLPAGVKPIRYSTRKRKLAGVLKVDDSLKPVDALTGVFYQLEADLVK